MSTLDDKFDECREMLQSKGAEYGPGGNEIVRITKAFNAITGLSIKPWHVSVLMYCMKMIRHSNTPKDDNWVDGIDYQFLGWEAEDAMDKR